MPIFLITFWKILTGISLKGWILIIVLLVFLAAAVYIGVLTNRLSKTQKQAKEAVSTENQIRVDESRKESGAAGNAVTESKANLRKTENANFQNTNLQDAERLRCQAFPERCK